MVEVDLLGGGEEDGDVVADDADEEGDEDDGEEDPEADRRVEAQLWLGHLDLEIVFVGTFEF